MTQPFLHEPAHKAASPFAKQDYSLPTPKAGGAHSGLNETVKFEATKGACNIVIPIAVTPGRRRLEPHISLVYDSTAGNGPFGIGWALDMPKIVRQTSQGVPRYTESDVFLLVEDGNTFELVPQKLANSRVREQVEYDVQRFIPLIGKVPFRLERWTSKTYPRNEHWRHISAENTITLYGTDQGSRIEDSPTSRIFSWLASERIDCYGNLMTFHYRSEDAVNDDETQHHQNTNRYIERILYGNQFPSQRLHAERSMLYHFEIFFNYSSLSPIEAGQLLQENGNPNDQWLCRLDAFSTSRSGFEVRTRRLCKDILMLHHFEHEASMKNPFQDAPEKLVRSFTFHHRHHVRGSQMTQFVESGHRGLDLKQKPPMDFTYNDSELTPGLDVETLSAVPSFQPFEELKWINLDGTCLPSLVGKSPNGYYMRENMSLSCREPIFTDWTMIKQWPSLEHAKVVDFDNDGRVEYVNYNRGFYRKEASGWSNFHAFTHVPNHEVGSTNTRIIDLTGNGTGDILVADKEAYIWYESLQDSGFQNPKATSFSNSENDSRPMLQPGQLRESLYLADMTGDGLLDLVRIQNGSICYWPNQGHGVFGRIILMKRSPRFEDDEAFSHTRLVLYDLDGSGTADLVYMSSSGGLDIYLNESGNGWTNSIHLPRLGSQHDLHGNIQVTDVFGEGTACVIFHEKRTNAMLYLNLFKSKKPRMLSAYSNGFGLNTTFEYTSTAQLQKRDLLSGQPWKLSIPFPIQCLTKIETLDTVQNSRTSRRFKYRDGYYDNHRREFNGFALVEEWNGPEGDYTTLHTKSWYFTGSIDQYSCYTSEDKMSPLELPLNLTGHLSREALRVAKGSLIEKHTMTGCVDEGSLVQSEKVAYRIEHQDEKNEQGVFRLLTMKKTTSIYEGEKIPRVHVYYVSKYDTYGNALSWIDMYFGLMPATSLDQDKSKLFITTRRVTEVISLDDDFRAPVECENRQVGKLLDGRHRDYATVSFSELREAGEMRLLRLSERFYRSDDLKEILPLGHMGSLGLVSYDTKLAFDQDDFRHLSQGLGASVVADLEQSGYVRGDDDSWYAQSGQWFFHQNTRSTEELIAAQKSFFTPTVHQDQFGNHQTLEYDDYWLVKVGLQLPHGVRTAAKYCYRHVSISQFIDKSGNSWAYEYDILGNLLREFEGAAAPRHGILVEDLEGADLQKNADGMLQGAVSYTEHDFESHPRRSIHIFKFKESTSIMISYYSGSGQICQERHLVEPQKWLVKATKLTASNNRVLDEYDPYYDSSSNFNPPPPNTTRVTSIHDGLDRTVLKIRQDGTWSWAEYKAWSHQHHDFNSTAILSLPENYKSLLGKAHRSLKVSSELNDSIYSGTMKVVHLDAEAHEIESAIELQNGEKMLNRQVYSIAGHVEKVFNSKGHCTSSHAYNKLGDAFWSQNADAGDQYMLRSVDGLITRLTKGTMRDATFLFDDIRRPTDDLDHGDVIVSRSYHENTNLANAFSLIRRVKTRGLTTTFERYDIRGNPEKYTQEINLPGLEFRSRTIPTFTFEKEYDLDARVLKSIFPDGQRCVYHYDSLGRLRNIEGVTRIDYNAKGHISTLSYDNTYKEAFEYDENHWLQRKASTLKGEVVQTTLYNRDIHGRIIKLDNHIDFRSDGLKEGASTQTYIYDALGRLVIGDTTDVAADFPEKHVGSSQTTPTRQNYTYDSENNILSIFSVQNGHEVFSKYSYEGMSNKLRFITKDGENVQDLDYDGESGMLGLPSRLNNSKFLWNAEQKLSGVVDTDLDTSFTYLYDSLGMRFAKISRFPDKVAVHVQFEEFNSNFELIRGNISLGEQSVTAWVGERMLGRSCKCHGFTTTLTDHLGSVTLEINSSLQPVVYRTYAHYGEIASETRISGNSLDATADVALEKFSGKRHDTETDFYYSRNRYLAAQLGRWLSPDPSGLAGGSTNLYCYADADPINNIDYDGLCPDKTTSTSGTNQGQSPTKTLVRVAEQGVLATLFYYAPKLTGREFLMKGGHPAMKIYAGLSAAALSYGMSHVLKETYKYYDRPYDDIAEKLVMNYGIGKGIPDIVDKGAVHYLSGNVLANAEFFTTPSYSANETRPELDAKNSLLAKTRAMDQSSASESMKFFETKQSASGNNTKAQKAWPNLLYSTALNRQVQEHLNRT